MNKKELYELVQEELGKEVDILKIDSNLATIINVLASESLKDFEMKYEIIRNEYVKACNNYENECEIFLVVMDKIAQRVLNSKNYIEISLEELEFCVGIIVVDAFIRCKIFKNPEGYNYVITR